MRKYALFIIGLRGSGKSTLIRSLTGCSKNRVWNVKTLSGQPLRAFVSLSSPQELGMSNYPPSIFPQCIERRYGVNRNDYDVFISALELIVRNQTLYGYQNYIKSTQNQGFDVRMAVIRTTWDNINVNSNLITAAQNFAHQNKIPILLVDASKDPNEESSRIRQNLYP